MLLILNMGLYFFMIIISSWIINHGIVRSRESAAILTIPARIFPIYFPMGNLATGFFVILSLLAGVVGFTSSVTGLYNLFLWNAPSIHATYASSLASLSLTLLAMGFACKEINIGWTDSVLVCSLFFFLLMCVYYKQWGICQSLRAPITSPP